MSGRSVGRVITVIRWTARVWSIFVLVGAAMMIVGPDPYSTGEPLPLGSMIVLGLRLVAVLGLLVAWRWEVVGATVTIGAIAADTVVFALVEGQWAMAFGSLAVFGPIFLIPAILFLVSWALSRERDVSPGAAPAAPKTK